MTGRLSIGIAVSLLAGCSPTLVKPETQIAGTLQTLSGEVAKFRQQRHDLAKARQDLVDGVQASAARLGVNTLQRTAVWTLTADKRAAAYQALLAATRASADAEVAFEQLQQQQAQALANADTKFALDTQKLADVIKALVTLATPQKLDDAVKFYVGFVLETRQKIEDQIKNDAAAAAAAAATERAAVSSNVTADTDAAANAATAAKKPGGNP